MTMEQANTIRFFGYVTGSVLLGIAFGRSAKKRGHRGWYWIPLSILLGPVFVYIAFRIFVGKVLVPEPQPEAKG
jgi:hypothetical protein